MSGNRYLGHDFKLRIDQEPTLAAGGWDLHAESGNWYFQALTADEVAERITAAVRDIFSVKHPTLLRVDNAGSIDVGVPPADVAPLVGDTDPAVR